MGNRIEWEVKIFGPFLVIILLMLGLGQLSMRVVRKLNNVIWKRVLLNFHVHSKTKMRVYESLQVMC